MEKEVYQSPETKVLQVSIEENFVDSVQYDGVGVENSANPVYNDFIWG